MTRTTCPRSTCPTSDSSRSGPKNAGQLREQLEEAEDYDTPRDPETGKLDPAEHLSVFAGVEKEIEEVLVEAHLAGIARDLTELSSVGDIAEATRAGTDGLSQPQARENGQEIDKAQELSVSR